MGIIVFAKGSKVHFAAKMLRNQGLYAEVVARPMKLEKSGCGYAIKFRPEEVSKIRAFLAEYKVNNFNIYRIVEPGVYEAI